MQIIGDPIGTVEVKVLTSQTHMYKLCSVWYMTKDPVSYTHLTLPTNREV